MSVPARPVPTAAQLTRALRDLLEFLDDHCNNDCSAPYSTQMREAAADARWLLDVPEEGW